MRDKIIELINKYENMPMYFNMNADLANEILALVSEDEPRQHDASIDDTAGMPREVWQTVCGDIPVFDKKETDTKIALRTIGDAVESYHQQTSLDMDIPDLVWVIDWLTQKKEQE